MWLILVFIFIPCTIASNEVPHAVWFKTILLFQDEYPSSNIFIAQSKGFDDLQVSSILASMLKKLSEGDIFAIIARITDIPKKLHYHRRLKHRQLFVVILKSISDLITFSGMTRRTDINLYPILLLFTKNISDFCHNPIGNQFNLNFNSKIMVKCGDSSIIQEWYSIHANTTKVNDLFIWNPNFGTFVKLTNLGFYERRNSLDGIGLRVSTKNYLNFTRISDDILKVLSQAAHFKIQIQPYQKSGGKLKQDMTSWSGVIGQIQKNQADIGLTSFGLTITPARLDVVDFSKVFLISRSKFYIKKFSKTRSMPSMYYKAIGIEAVYWLLIVLAGSPIVLTVIIAKQNQMSYRRILYDNYLYVWRIFCINPPPEPCRNLSTKVACLSLLFSAYVLYSVYSTLLVSYLAVLKHDMPFHSLEEFIDAKTHQIMSLKNNSLNEALEVSNDELMKTLRNFFVNSSNKSDTFQERSKQICESEEKLIFFADDIVFTNSDIDYPCELISFGNGLRNNKGFALVKGTPYKGLIDHYMQKMQDSGVLDALLRRYYKSPKMDANGYKAVNLQCTWPIFGVLGIGISLSFFIFVCEKFLGTISPRDTEWVD